MGKEVDPSDIGKFPGLIKSKFDRARHIFFKNLIVLFFFCRSSTGDVPIGYFGVREL